MSSAKSSSSVTCLPDGQWRRAVTAQFGDNHPIAGRQEFHLRLPHGVVEGMAVNEKDGRAGADILIGEIDSVRELNALQHSEIMLP